MTIRTRKIIEGGLRCARRTFSCSSQDRPAQLKESEILSAMTSGGLFKLLKKGERTYSFIKAKKR